MVEVVAHREVHIDIETALVIESAVAIAMTTMSIPMIVVIIEIAIGIVTEIEIVMIHISGIHMEDPVIRIPVED